MDDRDPVEVLADEFMTRMRSGERPSIDEYARRYPEHASEIRGAFPVLMVLEDVASEDGEDDLQAASGIDLASGDESQRILGDFRIISEIGRGGMGIVYEAEQMSLGRHVALKVLPRQAFPRPRQQKRFEQEARAAAQLHHSNIVPVFGVGEEDGTYYYVMQYIQGHSLYEVLTDLKAVAHQPEAAYESGHDEAAWPTDDTLASTGDASSLFPEADSVSGANAISPPDAGTSAQPAAVDAVEQRPTASMTGIDPIAADTKPHHVSDTFALSGGLALPESRRRSGQTTTDYWQSIARIGVQVADALDYAHDQGISHRDIKPGNLLLDSRGTVWVTDFGLAKMDDQDELTQTGDIVGTLRYMSPEALDGKGGPRGDIYSLGITLYELLALEPAFDEHDRQRLMRRIIEESPRSLRKVNPKIPRDLETIIHKAIEKSPRQRYQLASELAADLRRFINDQPIQARRITWIERLWRWCRRNPAISGITAAAITIIAMTVVIAFVMINGAKNRATDLARERGRLVIEKTELAERNQELAERAVAARQKAEQARDESEAVASFLLLETYDAASTGGEAGGDVTVRNLLDWSAARVDGQFANQPRQAAAVRDALGQAYDRLGLYQQAYEQFTSAFDLRKKTLGEEHLATLSSMVNLTLALNDLRRPTESKQLAEKNVEFLERTAGPEHPTTLAAKHQLARSLFGLRDYAASEKLIRENLAIQKRLLGDDHADTLASMTLLAMCRHRQGDFADATRILNDALDHFRNVYGSEHPKTLTALSNLAAAYSAQGEYATSERLFRDAWQGLSRRLGANHPTTLNIAENLAVSLQYQRKHADAEPILRDTLERRLRQSGQSHWQTGNTYSELGATLTALGRLEEAEEALLSGYRILNSAPDAPALNVKLTIHRLIRLYQAWKKDDAVTRWQATLAEFDSSQVAPKQN